MATYRSVTRTNDPLAVQLPSALPGEAMFALLEGMRDLVAAVDSEFRLLICNKAYADEMRRVFGTAPAVGDDALAILGCTPDRYGQLKAAWARALAGEAFTVSYTFGDPAVREEIYEVSFGPMQVGGEAAAFFIARNVTQRVHAEEEIRRQNADLEIRIAERAARLEQANRVLHEREERLSAALDASDTGTFRRDLRTGVAYWDANLQRLFGVEPSDRPRTMDELLAVVHPRDRQGIVDNYEQASRAFDLRTGVFRVVHPNGDVHWIHHRSRVYAGEDGRPAYVTGACSDVTALKLAQRAVEERENRIREMADCMPVMVWTRRHDLYLEYINRRWVEYTGLSLDEAREGGWEKVLHPDDRQRVLKAMADAKRRNVMLDLECQLRRGSDGAYRWHLMRSIPMLDHKGQLLRWYGTAIDIEEQIQTRRRLEQVKGELQRANYELAHSLAQLEGVVGSITEGLVLFDADGNRLAINAAGRRMHGIPQHGDVRQPRSESIESQEVRDLEGNPLPYDQWPSTRALRGETFSGAELTMRRLDNGAEWTASYSGAPVYDAHGRQIYAVVTFRDVTARRHTEQALQAAVEARDRFLSIASHELRTPLTTLTMQLQMARRRVDPAKGTAPTPEELARTLDVANRQTGRLAKLVDDLLDVSRSDIGRLEFRLQPVDLGELVDEVCGQFAITLEQAGCRLTRTLQPGVVGQWDAARLEQVIGNLLSNVTKYAAGSPVHVELARVGDRARLRIRDSGPGIPAEYRARIFDRFERYVQDSAITGLGLGLYLAKQIVEGHGGTIALCPGVSAGTCFEINLPLEPRAG